VADWETKRRWVHYAFEQLEQAGYDIGSAYTAVKKDRNVTFVYRDELWRGADLLSLGVASFGHINGIHYQNEHDMDGYLDRLGRAELPVYRAHIPTDDERLIREFVLQFKLGSVDQAYFLRKFGVDATERFAEPLRRLAAWGFLRGDADQVTLNRDGLLEIDRLLHEFFLPRHRDARYA
jgi:oxygen-independent coproporphyrinogen-3 oxidase